MVVGGAQMMGEGGGGSAFLEGLRWDHPAAERLRTNAFLFSVICLYSMLNVIFSPLSKKRELSALALAIHACGCVSYFMMGNHWCPVVQTTEGWPLLVGRILEWSVSVPLFVYMLAQLIDPRTKNVRRDQIKQSAAILIGGAAPLFPRPVAWACFILSCVLQAMVLRTMHNYMRQMERSVGRRRDRAMLFVAHVGTMTLFASYPVIFWLGTMSQRITPELETMIFSWTDLVTKFIFTSVLCNLTTRAYDFDLVDYSEHFWRFVRVLEVPVFALSTDNRIVYWNSRMEDATTMPRSAVTNMRLSQLTGVFSKETRRSLTMLADRGIRARLEGRYEVPVLVGEASRILTFSVLSNPIKEANIPKTVFVGVQSDSQDSSAFVQLAYYIHNYGQMEGSRAQPQGHNNGTEEVDNLLIAGSSRDDKLH